MLTIYPETGYDSFCSVADADLIIDANIPEAQHALWDALTEEAKEVQLRQSTLIIKNKITLPEDLENDLKLACAYLANSSVGKEMSDDDGKGDVKIKEIVGVVKTEWFTARSGSNSLPDIVTMLLKQYEVISTSSFTFCRA